MVICQVEILVMAENCQESGLKYNSADISKDILNSHFQSLASNSIGLCWNVVWSIGWLVRWLHLFLFGYFAILRLAETFYTFQLCVHLLDSLSIGWLVHWSVKLLSGQSKMSEQTNYFVYTCFIRTRYLIILKYQQFEPQKF